MSEFEVPQPIVCSPFEEPAKHWHLEEGTAPTEAAPGRRPAHYFYREPGKETDEGAPTGTLIELKLVNLVRARLNDWRRSGYPGVTAMTLELLNYWRRDGRAFRPFFAQLEAVETIIFLNEARRDHLQGIDIPRDEPSDKQKEEIGYKSQKRYHVCPLPGRASLAITFPRVEGYRQAIRNRVSVDWSTVPPLWLDPAKIPPEVEVKAAAAARWVAAVNADGQFGIWRYAQARKIAQVREILDGSC